MRRLVVYSLTGFCAAAGFSLGYMQEKRTLSPTKSFIASEQARSREEIAIMTGTASSGPLLPTPARTSIQNITAVTSLEEILALPSPLHRHGAFKAWLDSVPPTQYAGIFSELMNQSQNWPMIPILFLTWGERAPEDGVRFLRKVPVEWQREYAENYFYKGWGDVDRVKARVWCEKNLRGSELYRALKSISDKPQTTEAILAINDRNVRYMAIREYFTTKAGENRMRAIDEAVKIPMSQDRIGAARAVLDQWGEADPVSAMLWLKGQNTDVFPADMKSRLEDMLFQHLFTKDLVAAKRFAADTPAGNTRNSRMDGIASRMVSEDLESAVAYFEEIKAGDPTAIPYQFFRAWVNADPERASGRLREELQRVFQSEAKGNAAWGIGEIMSDWIVKDPAAAAKFAVTLPEIVQPHLLQTLTKFWVREDGAKAAQWVQGLPQGKTRDEAMRHLGAAWSEHDTTRSTEWLNQLPQNSSRWIATEGIASTTIDNNPDAALSLVRSITDETERVKVLANVWKSWAGRNKPSAEDWIKSANLSDAERVALTPPKEPQ